MCFDCVCYNTDENSHLCIHTHFDSVHRYSCRIFTVSIVILLPAVQRPRTSPAISTFINTPYRQTRGPDQYRCLEPINVRHPTTPTSQYAPQTAYQRLPMSTIWQPQNVVGQQTSAGHWESNRPVEPDSSTKSRDNESLCSTAINSLEAWIRECTSSMLVNRLLPSCILRGRQVCLDFSSRAGDADMKIMLDLQLNDGQNETKVKAECASPSPDTTSTVGLADWTQHCGLIDQCVTKLSLFESVMISNEVCVR